MQHRRKARSLQNLVPLSISIRRSSLHCGADVMFLLSALDELPELALWPKCKNISSPTLMLQPCKSDLTSPAQLEVPERKQPTGALKAQAILCCTSGLEHESLSRLKSCQHQRVVLQRHSLSIRRRQGHGVYMLFK